MAYFIIYSFYRSIKMQLYRFIDTVVGDAFKQIINITLSSWKVLTFVFIYVYLHSDVIVKNELVGAIHNPDTISLG